MPANRAGRFCAGGSRAAACTVEWVEPFDELDSPAGVSHRRAAHWADFYDRLLDFERQILARMVTLAEQLPPDEATAVEETNITPLRDLIQEFEVRAAAWRAAADGHVPGRQPAPPAEGS